MSTPTYNAAYFIAKFEAIPEEKWFVGDFMSPNDDTIRCALGHCGCGPIDTALYDAEELLAIICKHLKGGETVARINDGRSPLYPQPTPKQRILAWLRDAQAAGL